MFSNQSLFSFHDRNWKDEAVSVNWYFNINWRQILQRNESIAPVSGINRSWNRRYWALMIAINWYIGSTFVGLFQIPSGGLVHNAVIQAVVQTPAVLSMITSKGKLVLIYFTNLHRIMGTKAFPHDKFLLGWSGTRRKNTKEGGRLERGWKH